jgi:signal transduction histidine kinase
MSFRLRLTLFGAGVVAATLLVFGWLVYQLVAHTQAAEQDKALGSRAADALLSIKTAAASQLTPSAGGPVLTSAEDLLKNTDVFIELMDSSGTVVASTARVGSSAPAIPLDFLQRASSSATSLATVDQPSGPQLRVDIKSWTRPDLGLEGYVAAGQPTSIQATNLKGIGGFLIVSAIPTLLGAFLATWLVSSRALRPLKAAAETADAIGRTRDLKRRLTAGKRRDEIGRLSTNFNSMLQRLEEANQQLAAALDTQRRFVADASHELRTPLTTILGNAELLAYGPAVSDEVRAAANRDIASESKRMSRLVENLLLVAQADSGHSLQLAPLNLRPLMEDVVRQARAVHPGRQFSSAGTTDVMVNGDRDALTQLVWILVDNAVKFTDEGGRIAVALNNHDAAAELIVTDDGIGIPEGELERIFERFYRADLSRSGKGAGLGLSIARWIVGQHGGTVTARNRYGPGATFVVTLPQIPG